MTDTYIPDLRDQGVSSTPARLVHLLKCRRRIENAFKHLAAHNGIDWLCNYMMDIVTNQRPVTNPAHIPGDTRPITYQISPKNRSPATRLLPKV